MPLRSKVVDSEAEGNTIVCSRIYDYREGRSYSYLLERPLGEILLAKFLFCLLKDEFYSVKFNYL